MGATSRLVGRRATKEGCGGKKNASAAPTTRSKSRVRAMMLEKIDDRDIDLDFLALLYERGMAVE